MDREDSIEGFEGRVETGPVQFGEDWHDTLIRGDSGAWYVMSIQAIWDKHLENLIKDFSDSNVNKQGVQL